MSVTDLDDATLADARDWLRERVDVGERCPCCRQFAKVYKRRLNSGIARALIAMYRQAGTEWIHKPSALSGLGAAARDESIARYWGLVVEETERRDDGGRAGWWRVTDAGEAFVLDRLTVPKYARIYDARCLGLAGELVSIRECLGRRFDYNELMSLA